MVVWHNLIPLWITQKTIRKKDTCFKKNTYPFLVLEF